MNQKARSTAEGGVVQKLLSIFTGMSDPDADKKKILKALGKDLSRSKFKFYRPKGQEALPGLAKFFYELYKLTAPSQVLLGQRPRPRRPCESFVIDSYLSKEQKLGLRAPHRGLYPRKGQDPQPQGHPGPGQGRPDSLPSGL